jgi:hypothetical protein
VPITVPPTNPWRDRVWKEFHAGNLTRAYRDVLLTLATFRGAGGLICPAHATLAERASCSVSTVRRALAQAFRLALVSWTERRIRAGWRWLRTSNAYRLAVPDGPVRRRMRPAWPRRRTTGQYDGEGENLKKKEALSEMLRAAAALPDLLALRRATMAARLGRAARAGLGVYRDGGVAEPAGKSAVTRMQGGRGAMLAL